MPRGRPPIAQDAGRHLLVRGRCALSCGADMEVSSGRIKMGTKKSSRRTIPYPLRARATALQRADGFNRAFNRVIRNRFAEFAHHRRDKPKKRAKWLPTRIGWARAAGASLK